MKGDARPPRPTPKYRSDLAVKDKFGNFIHSFGAARMLLARAKEAGYLLEGLALYASMTDGFLRMGLVLKRQIANRTAEIDESLISQEESGSYYTDRTIQRLAFDEGVIKQTLFSEIGALYDKRNNAIHRYFLTALKYRDLEKVLDRYELVYKQLFKLLWDLEAEQIEQGVGIARSSKPLAHFSARRLKLDILENKIR